MNVVPDPRRLELDAIVERCVEETEKWRRRLEQDTRYCFELFRRALVDTLDDALQQVLILYVPMLSRRAQKHKFYPLINEESEHLARVALTNFYNRCQGVRFEEMFSSFPAVMAYLRACLHSAIAQNVREQPRSRIIPLEELETGPAAPPDPTQSDDLREGELWARIRRVLDDPDDELLAYQRYVLQMKPSEIVKQKLSRYESSRAVSVALQRIHRKLENDDDLKNAYE